MFYNTDSLLDDSKKEFIEKSVDKDSRSNNCSHKQTVMSQKYVTKYDSILTSMDNKYENNYLSMSMSEKTKTEDDKNDKTISIIDKEMPNNSKDNSQDLTRSKSKKRAFSLIDRLISTSIVAPLTIGFWRSVWASMDRHAELFPSWFCFTFGAALHAAYTIFKDQFHNVYMKKWAKLSCRKRLLYRALRILYTYTFGVACIAHWRGGWIIIDNYLFMHMWITISLIFSLLVCLVILRSVRNLIATPLIIFIDTPSCVFQFPTRYNVVVKENSFSNVITRIVSKMIKIQLFPMERLIEFLRQILYRYVIEISLD